MTYTTAEGRQQLLATIAEAVAELEAALGHLGAAYDEVDEQTADRLEETLFRPVQLAAGRAKRTATEFAHRHGLAPTPPAVPGGVVASRDVRESIDDAADAVAEAEAILSDLQDSMLPVAVGDAPLRAGLAEIRDLVRDIPARSDAFLRTFGR